MKRPRNESSPLRAFRSILLVGLGMVILSSCVSVPDDPGIPNVDADSSESSTDSNSPGAEGTDTPIASSLSSATPEGEALRFDILSLERHSQDLLVLRMRITNLGEEEAWVFQTLAESGGPGTTPNGVSLIDMRNNKRYMPFTLADGETCHCSDWSGQEKLSPDSNIDTWAAFPSPPDSVNFVAVTTPVTPDFLDIPITEAPSPNSTIIDVQVSEPRILDIHAFQDDLSGDSSRTESDKETSILLSSDVLFDLNESTLTKEADEVLQNVAEEIESASGTIIQIDGYTDDTGNHAVNNPLSEDRATAVANRLEELINRDDITFETAGHGSSNPVGDNSTEEGRAKNRRVTITFAK